MIDTNRVREEVESLADASEPVKAAAPAEKDERYQSFPVDALPEPLARFVEAGAKAIHCSSSYLALPVLAVAAAMIGTSRVLELKQGWQVPSILWVGIVGESGTSKTPSLRLVLRPIVKRQTDAFKRYDEAMKRFKADKARYDKTLKDWTNKAAKGSTELPPLEPQPPTVERCSVSDTTIEALAKLLLENPRGLFVHWDELAGWLDFDRYTSGKGDAARWLSMYSGEGFSADRKTAIPPTIFVPRAAVSICGGIQPAILARALRGEHCENGLKARLLLGYPPRRVKKWTENEIDKAVEREYATLLNRLAGFQPATDEEGDPCPAVLRLSPDAKSVYTEFYNRHGAEQAELTGDLAAAWSKLEEIPARLALIIRCVKVAHATPASEPWKSDHAAVDASEVDADDMQRALRLTAWFKRETRRVYALLSESDEERDQRQLVEWIERKGGEVTVTEVQRDYHPLRAPGLAEAALNELVKAKLGVWCSIPPGPNGGRPTSVFRLSMRANLDETPKNAA